MIRHDDGHQREFLIVSMKEECNWESINVGDTVNGTVRKTGWLKNCPGDFVDLGTNIDGFLSYEESTNGFPFKRLRPGDPVIARVLGKDSKTLHLTRKSGHLARPNLTVFDSKADLSPFASRSPDEWFDGQVVRMRPSNFIVVAVQLPGTTAYTTGLLYTKDATDAFLKVVSVGMTTKVQIKKVTVEPRQLFLSMRELVRNSDGAQESKDSEVEEDASISESSQHPLTEAAVEEDASISESSQNPLAEAANEEDASIAESSQNPSAEAASEEDTSNAESSRNPSTEAGIEEDASISESSQNPLTEAANEEDASIAESSQSPSAEAASEEVTSNAESSRNWLTEAAIEEDAPMSQSLKKPSSEAAIQEAVPTSESPQKPSTEAVPGKTAEPKAPAKENSNPFEDLMSGLFR